MALRMIQPESDELKKKRAYLSDLERRYSKPSKDSWWLEVCIYNTQRWINDLIIKQKQDEKGTD